MAATQHSSRYHRPSQLHDHWKLPGLIFLLLGMLASAWLWLQSLQTVAYSDRFFRLEHWQNAIGGGIFLCLLIVLIAGFRLRRQIYVRETQLDKREDALLAERHGLESIIKERTAEFRAEVEERRRAELLNRGRNQVLELLARNQETNQIIDVLLRTIVEQRTLWGAALHQLQGDKLVLRASANIRPMLLEHLRSIDIGFADAPEAATFQSKNPHVIEDMTLTGTPFGQLLTSNGIYSAFSVPFFTPGGDVIGVCTVYSRLRGRPGTRDHELLDMAASMASVVMEHERLHQELMHHAYQDVLTGLPNRRIGEGRLDLALAQAERKQSSLAVLWLDLDGFKQINDTHGHPTGDLVLQETARRLSRRVRAADSLARMGGDEFMIVAQDVQDRESAEDLAAELHSLISAPINLGDAEVSVTTSIGIALYPADGLNAEELKLTADRAMYQAKAERAGTRYARLDAPLRSEEFRDLADALAFAMEDPEQTVLAVHYQPQCDYDGNVVAFEALLRFRHPLLGPVSPATFIPIAEETGLIIPLGAWVLRHVCNQSMEWQRLGHHPFRVAVNISPLEFARPNFAAGVARILDETGLAPDLLELELTESLVMNDVSESTRQLTYLSHLGVSIAIDDFGTGHSSLSCLHQLPIDILKIDRSFVEKLTWTEGSRPIVQSIINMAHKLGMKVVAEGVETTNQLDILAQDGCDTVQGFLFSPALRADQAIDFLLRDGRAPGGREFLPARVSDRLERSAHYLHA